MNEQTQSPHEDYNVDFSDILAEVATEAPVLDDASNEASPADTAAGFAAVRSHYMQQATEHILALHNDASLNLAEMNLRFSTAINLNRMENTRVCIIGVGGIGTWLVRCLVGMGFKRITIIDDDEVEIHNIGPQAHNLTTLGMSKVDAMHDAMLEFRGVSIRTIKARVESYTHLVEDLLLGESPQVLITAIDNMALRNSLGNTFIINIEGQSVLPQHNTRLPEMYVDLRMGFGEWVAGVLPCRALKSLYVGEYGDTLDEDCSDAIGKVESALDLFQSNLLFDQSEGIQEACTERAIVYTGCNLGSYVAALLHWYIDNPFSTLEQLVGFMDRDDRELPFHWIKEFNSRTWKDPNPLPSPAAQRTVQALLQQVADLSAALDEYRIGAAMSANEAEAEAEARAEVAAEAVAEQVAEATTAGPWTMPPAVEEGIVASITHHVARLSRTPEGLATLRVLLAGLSGDEPSEEEEEEEEGPASAESIQEYARRVTEDYTERLEEYRSSFEYQDSDPEEEQYEEEVLGADGVDYEDGEDYWSEDEGAARDAYEAAIQNDSPEETTAPTHESPRISELEAAIQWKHQDIDTHLGSQLSDECYAEFAEQIKAWHAFCSLSRMAGGTVPVILTLEELKLIRPLVTDLMVKEITRAPRDEEGHTNTQIVRESMIGVRVRVPFTNTCIRTALDGELCGAWDRLSQEFRAYILSSDITVSRSTEDMVNDYVVPNPEGTLLCNNELLRRVSCPEAGAGIRPIPSVLLPFLATAPQSRFVSREELNTGTWEVEGEAPLYAGSYNAMAPDLFSLAVAREGGGVEWEEQFDVPFQEQLGASTGYHYLRNIIRPKTNALVAHMRNNL